MQFSGRLASKTCGPIARLPILTSPDPHVWSIMRQDIRRRRPPRSWRVLENADDRRGVIKRRTRWALIIPRGLGCWCLLHCSVVAFVFLRRKASFWTVCVCVRNGPIRMCNFSCLCFLGRLSFSSFPLSSKLKAFGSCSNLFCISR